MRATAARQARIRACPLQDGGTDALGAGLKLGPVRVDIPSVPSSAEVKDVMAQLLVVEDNPDILHLIWTQMRARGHQVLGATSGPEALAAVELWGPPQVAVLDVAMPAMDGLELLQQLRAATGTQELPAIFLSARVDRATVEAAHRLGAAYLAKPFIEEVLYAAIEAALASGSEGLHTAVEQAKQRSPSP
jgi:CheY-like chemotaxis protein